MNENENVGFEDFETALFGEDYHIDADDNDFEADETDDTEDGDVIDDSADDADVDEDEEVSSDEDEEEPDEENSEAEEEDTEEEGSDEQEAAQTFTLKVNKEEQKVTLEEMTALAQKGADYDRVKEKYLNSQQTIQDLQTKLDGLTGRQGVLDILELVAAKTGTDLEQMAEMLYVNVRKSAGVSEDTAKEEMKSAKLEKELNSIKEQKSQKQQEETAETRAQREIEAFRNDYPDVKLTDELVNKLTPELQKGMSLSNAYRNLEKAQAEARIKELEQQLAAKKQNDKNKKASPGSQKDSGGRRTRSDYEEFERALFG